MSAYPKLPPIPPASAGVEAAHEWLLALAPKNGDRLDLVYHKLGFAYMSVLGATLDLLFELRKERAK